MATREHAIDRFVRRLSFPESGCWEWTGCIFPNGYGAFRYPGGMYAHRFAYEYFINDIPVGKCLDHLCRNRKCCNPEHLEAVTQRENILRSPVAPAARNARKTHCVHGHSLANAYLSHNGRHRQCRVCSSQSSARYYSGRRLREQQGAA